MNDILLRPATPPDTPAILGLIIELAEFENLRHLVEATTERLHAHLFGDPPAARCMVAEHADGIVAFALYFNNYSTFLGKPGLYLEDLYVQPAHRGSGLGRRLLIHLAGVAAETGCGRFEWSVLEWNHAAIGFYEKMGATVLADWRICRVTGPALEAMASLAVQPQART